MTSAQESSGRPLAALPVSELESLAGVFHPHAIEIQDFSHYALVIDVRPRTAFVEDHIPGAVQIDPDEVRSAAFVTGADHIRASTPLVAQDSGDAVRLPARLANVVA